MHKYNFHPIIAKSLSIHKEESQTEQSGTWQSVPSGQPILNDNAFSVNQILGGGCTSSEPQRIEMPEPAAMQQVPAISFLFQASPIIFLCFHDQPRRSMNREAPADLAGSTTGVALITRRETLSPLRSGTRIVLEKWVAANWGVTTEALLISLLMTI